MTKDHRVRGRIEDKQMTTLSRAIRIYAANTGTGSTAVTLDALELDLDLDMTALPAATPLLWKQGNNFTVGSVTLRGRVKHQASASQSVWHSEGTVGEYRWHLDADFTGTSAFGIH